MATCQVPAAFPDCCCEFTVAGNSARTHALKKIRRPNAALFRLLASAVSPLRFMLIASPFAAHLYGLLPNIYPEMDICAFVIVGFLGSALEEQRGVRCSFLNKRRPFVSVPAAGKTNEEKNAGPAGAKNGETAAPGLDVPRSREKV